MKTKDIIRKQLDNKIIKFENVKDLSLPSSGWVHALRQALNMSLRQLGQRLGITAQSVREIEQREKEGTISIRVLEQVAVALDMKLVYGFIPAEGSLAKMIEARAEEMAHQIVERTSMQMALEDQEISSETLQSAINDKKDTLSREVPKQLWD